MGMRNVFISSSHPGAMHNCGSGEQCKHGMIVICMPAAHVNTHHGQHVSYKWSKVSSLFLDLYIHWVALQLSLPKESRLGWLGIKQARG